MAYQDKGNALTLLLFTKEVGDKLKPALLFSGCTPCCRGQIFMCCPAVLSKLAQKESWVDSGCQSTQYTCKLVLSSNAQLLHCPPILLIGALRFLPSTGLHYTYYM